MFRIFPSEVEKPSLGQTSVSMKDLIEMNRTPNGGWTKDFLASIGVPWPPPKGWRSRLEGDASD